MTSLAEAAKGRARQVCLPGVHGNQFDTGAGDESVQITQSVGAISRLDDNRGLDKTRDGHSSQVGGLDCLKETTALGLPLQDCQDCGSIDHHQRGKPASSYPRISSARLPSSIGKL